MKKTIELFTGTTGWTLGSGMDVSSNGHKDFVADELGTSLIIHFPGTIGLSATKSAVVDVTGMTEIVFHTWSRYLRKLEYKVARDFAYTIDFGGGHIFYLPFFDGFTDVAIGINGWTGITQVKITALTDTEDWIILSGMYAVKDEYPLDVFAGVKSGIEAALSELSPSGIATGRVTCSAGDVSVQVTGVQDLVDRMAVLRIGSELHQIQDFDGQSIRFTSRFDGAAMLSSHASEQAYVALPVDYGVEEKEAAIPGVTVWGMAPYPNQDEQDIAVITDTFAIDGSVAERREIFMQEYPILIDCEARTPEVLVLLGRAVRWWSSSNKVWVNSRKHDMKYSDPPEVIEPEEGVEMYPKIQYLVRIEVHEERAKRTYVPAWTSNVMTVQPEIIAEV